MSNRSKYATQILDLRSDRKRSEPPHGLCVHTSGSGVLAKAKRQNRFPDDVAIDHYDSAVYSTHYMAGHRGYYQFSDDMERVQHIGYSDRPGEKGILGGPMTPNQRRAWYLSNQWCKDSPAAFVQRWDAAWPGYKSPSHLHPSKWPSSDYVAIELVPVGSGFGGVGLAGGRYTLAQHIVVACCAHELEMRWGYPPGWERTSRLVGHEDVGPHCRVRGGEGWDPGRHREKPWVHWETIRAWIGICRDHGSCEWPLAMAALLDGWPR